MKTMQETKGEEIVGLKRMMFSAARLLGTGSVTERVLDKFEDWLRVESELRDRPMYPRLDRAGYLIVFTPEPMTRVMRERIQTWIEGACAAVAAAVPELAPKAMQGLSSGELRRMAREKEEDDYREYGEALEESVKKSRASNEKVRIPGAPMLEAALNEGALLYSTGAPGRSEFFVSKSGICEHCGREVLEANEFRVTLGVSLRTVLKSYIRPASQKPAFEIEPMDDGSYRCQRCREE